MEKSREEQKRLRRQELLQRLNDYEERARVSRHEPSEEELKNANELEVELERERNWRSSGGFVRPG
jgi:hypothetical protein